MLTERMADGKPRLQVFNTCTNLIREIPSLRIKAGTDDVDKDLHNDHAADALRYAIMSRMPHPSLRHVVEEPDLREERARRLIEKARSQAASEIVL